MISSMTGYASLTHEFLGENYRLEIRSVNHRFLDLKLRLPKEWNALEIPIRKLVETKIKRGAVELWIEKVQSSSAANEPQIDLDMAVRVYQRLQELRKRVGMSTDIQIRDLLAFPEVIVKTKGIPIAEASVEQLWTHLEPALSELLQSHLEMRSKEGKHLESILQTNLLKLAEFQRLAAEKRNALIEKIAEKKKLKITALFEAYPLPQEQVRALLETRIAQEINLTLDKTDIEEELDRLVGHIDHFKSALQETNGVGKKLEFLCQELHREVTTMGNKAQDLGLSEIVVQAKVLVEQIREQIANIE